VFLVLLLVAFQAVSRSDISDIVMFVNTWKYTFPMTVLKSIKYDILS
jgi:hypothetical protein